MPLILLCIFFLLEADIFASPSSITDLTTFSSGYKTIKLKWSAPIESTTIWYEVRTSTYRQINNETDWNDNSSDSSYPYRIKWTTESFSGKQEILIITGLVNNLIYYFGIKSSTDYPDPVDWSSLDTTNPRPYIYPQNKYPNNNNPFPLSFPVNGSIVFTLYPEFDWPDINPGSTDDLDKIGGDYIKQYTLFYSTKYNSSIQTSVNIISPLTSYYKLTSPLQENTTYYWKVGAYDSESLYVESYYPQPDAGVWGRFIVNAVSEPPTAVNLLFPFDGYISTKNVPSFDWTDALDPDPYENIKYILLLSSISSSGPWIEKGNILISTYTIQSGEELQENTTYWWYIKSIDSSGLVTPSTYTYRLMINTVNESPTMWYLIYPVTGTIVRTLNPLLKWSTGYDPDPGDSVKYQIEISTDINFYNYSPPHNLPYYYKEPNLVEPQFQTGPLLENTTYYWRIYTSDNNNITVLSHTESFITDAINTPPQEFSLLEPYIETSTNTLKPNFKWQNSSTIEPLTSITYSIFYSTDVNFNVFYSSEGLINNNFIVEVPLFDNTTYWWFVKAIDTKNIETVSTTFWFVTDVSSQPPNNFSLISPLNNFSTSYLSEINFEWENTSDPDPLDFIKYYKIIFSTDSMFNIFFSSDLVNTKYISKIKEFITESTYYWKVKAISDKTGETETPARTFYTKTYGPEDFNLIQPLDNLTTSYLNTVYFDWSDTYGLDPGDIINYEIQYTTDSLFNIYVSSIVNFSSYTLTGLSNNTTYYWRIKAIGIIGGGIKYSQIWKFYTKNLPPQKFNLIFPENYSIITSSYILLNWDESLDIENNKINYILFYSTDINFNIYKSTQTDNNFYILYQKDVLENYKYYWKVQARDYWSDTFSVSTYCFFVNITSQPPQNFNLLFPVNKTVDTVEFKWQETFDPDPLEKVLYEIWYSTDFNFSLKTEIKNLFTTTYKLENVFLIGNTTYYWRVKAYSNTDTENFTLSEIEKFFTPSKYPKEPQNLSVSVNSDGTELTLSWEPVTYNEDGSKCNDLTGYKIYRTKVLSEENFLAIVSSYTTIFKDTTVDKRSFYYFVKAVNLYGLESKYSKSVYIDQENKTSEFVFFDEQKLMSINISSDIYKSIDKGSGIDVNINRINTEETQDIPYVYDIKIIDKLTNKEIKSLPQVITLNFNYTALKMSGNMSDLNNSDYNFAYYNTIEWIILGKNYNSNLNNIYIKTKNLGKFRLEKINVSNNEFTLLNWPPKNKIITPNNDNNNDDFRIYFKNAENRNVSGKVFDLTGTYICELKINNSENYIYWDAKDSYGNIVNSGIYIYQIKTGNKVVNGTVVIAR